MEKEILGWTVLALQGLIGAIIWFVIRRHDKLAEEHGQLSQTMSAKHAQISDRMTRVETLLMTFSETAAKVLHSPHTPELDELLEKYLSRNYELTNEEWARLKLLCAEIEDNVEEPKEGRALAGWMRAVAEHKLFEPPRQPRKHL